MLKVSHRKPTGGRRKIKGSLTMKKKKHASTRKAVKITRPRPRSMDKHKVRRPKAGTRSKAPGYQVHGGRVHYRTRTGKVGSMPEHHVGMVRNWGLRPVKRLYLS